MRRPADVKPPTIKQLARSKWQSSGLTDENARRLGYRALTGAAVKARSVNFHEAGALFLPYFDLRGKPTRFYRLRYLEALPGADGLVEKPQRYDQLPVMQEVYYPPLLDRTWEEIVADPSTPVCITEGELKAACACAHGITTMALGGVYSFMSSKKGVPLLPSLEAFDWKEREVFIIYDNDITHKIQVMQAQTELAKVLSSRGAKCHFVSLPAGPEKGLDDFIVKHGSDKLTDLFETAEPFEESQALWEMNSHVVLIKDLNIVVERSTHLLMHPEVFSNTTYANRFHVARILKGQGEKKFYAFEKTQTAPKWIEWEQRSELRELTYEPGQPRVIAARAWNTWDGWGVVPKKGDVRPWVWLLDFLFANDKKARRYFEQWCAYPIQHPGAKLYSAVVLWSRVKRLGKSMVALALSKIYGKNSIFVESRQLKGSFNPWAKNRQLIIGEEITAGDTRVDADFLKFIITSPVVTINEKMRPQHEHPNHANFLFLSNHPDAVFLEDGDKRYMIHAVTQTSPGPREKYEWCDKWLHGSGPSHLMDYLLNLSLKGFNPREHAPETLSKYEMIIAGKTDIGLWIMRLQEDAVTALRPLGEKVSQECDLFTASQLYHAFDPNDRARGKGSVGSLGRHLSAAGFRRLNGGLPMATGAGDIDRLWAVRNVVKWEQSSRAQIREHYQQFFGPKVAGGVK